MAYDESSDDDQVNDQAEQLIFQSRRSTGARSIRPLAQTVVEYFNRIEYLYEHRDEPLGVPTGLIDLDKLLGGLQVSDCGGCRGAPISKRRSASAI